MRNDLRCRMMAGVAAGLCGVLLSAVPGYGAQTSTQADEIPVAEGYGGVTFTSGPNGSITVLFGEQSTREPPGLSCGVTAADVGVSDGAFVGDYIKAGVRVLTFKITGDGHLPGSAMVVLKNKDGRAWCNRSVQVVAEAGVATINNISFERSAGWDRNERPNVDKDAMWLADLRNVGTIGITLSQGGTEAQSYTISDFMLVDLYGGTSRPGVLSPLEQALLDAFGVKDIALLTGAQLARDVDGDGMPDIIEIRSEHETGFANTIFVAEILAVDEEGVTIRWPCVKDAEYTVFRAKSLFSQFSTVGGAVRLKATETGYMTYKDTTAAGAGPYFYRILKRAEEP